jgi:TonB family protein
VATAPSLLDGAAIEAVQEWEFKPAARDGAPIALPIVVTVNFSMR